MDKNRQDLNDEFPWDWIGFQGSGQHPMTQTQFDWLQEHNMSREEYMRKVDERRERK